MTEERQEKNRKIAEWAGFHRLADSTDPDLIQWHHPDCRCEADAPEDRCKCPGGCYWGEDNDPPDFYVLEYASALILDKLPLAQVTNCGDLWCCSWLTPQIERSKTETYGSDRRTAIADSALAYIESLAAQEKK